MSKGVLGDYQYVVEAQPDSVYQVYKMTGLPNEDVEPYWVDEKLCCSCPAGEFGNDCKHVKMVERSLLGQEVSWRKALLLTRAYSKILKDQFQASVESVLQHKQPEATVRVSHLLVHGAIASADRPRLTVWQEYGRDVKLLLVIHAFWDRDRYEKSVQRILEKAGKSGS